MTVSRESIIRLALAVYQVTALFPEKEPLQRQIREKANYILADFVSFNPQNIDKNKIIQEIDALLAYFSVAEKQNWVNYKNFRVLSREYRKIRDFLKEISLKSPEASEKREIAGEIKRKLSKKSFFGPSIRQKKIIEIVKDRGEVSLSELRDIFSQVTPRTLRRDLSALTKKNIIERIRKGKENILFVLNREFDKGQIADRK